MVITMAKLRMAHASTHGAWANSAKIQGETDFRTREFPRSGSKAKDGEKKKKKKEERPKVGNNNGQLRIANDTSGGTRKAELANYYTTLQSEGVGILTR